MIKESYYVSLWTMEQSIKISNMDEQSLYFVTTSRESEIVSRRLEILFER